MLGMYFSIKGYECEKCVRGRFLRVNNKVEVVGLFEKCLLYLLPFFPIKICNIAD